jgi:hypothetical protein
MAIQAVALGEAVALGVRRGKLVVQLTQGLAVFTAVAVVVRALYTMTDFFSARAVLALAAQSASFGAQDAHFLQLTRVTSNVSD